MIIVSIKREINMHNIINVEEAINNQKSQAYSRLSEKLQKEHTNLKSKGSFFTGTMIKKDVSLPCLNSIHWSGVITKKEIQTGSFSQVKELCPYEIKNCVVQFGKSRAIKIIKKNYDELEIKIACGLYPDFYYPHVIKVDNDYYLNMRLAKSDLFEQMFNKSWQRNTNFSHRINIILKLARDLKRLHADKFAHLDIKPENILITEDNVYYWADFGFTRKIGTRAPHGSAAYMAPEIFINDKVTVARDVFALAVTTWGIFCEHRNIIDNINGKNEITTIFEKRNKMVRGLLTSDSEKFKIHAPVCYTPEQQDDIIKSENPNAIKKLIELLQNASNPDPNKRCTLDDFILKLENIKKLELEVANKSNSKQANYPTTIVQECMPLLYNKNIINMQPIIIPQKYTSKCQQRFFTLLPRRTTINNIGIGVGFLFKIIDGICNSSQKYNSQNFDTRTIPHIATSATIVFYIIGVKVYNYCCRKQKSRNKCIKLKQAQDFVSIGFNGAQVGFEILHAVAVNYPIYRFIFNASAITANTLDDLAFGIVDTVHNCAFAREDYRGCISLFFSMISKLFNTAGDIAITAGFIAASILFSKEDILTTCIVPGLVALWFLAKSALTCPANTIDDCVTVHNDSRFEDVTDIEVNEQELDVLR